jgi:hypothetical protein
VLLKAAREVVRPDGFIAVIHWRSDIPTPRGPPLDIRPLPGQIATWAAAADLAAQGEAFPLPPWHYGMNLRRS